MTHDSTGAKSFSAVLRLLHKVLKLKGGVRNVSMQLFDWGRETLSEDSRNSLTFPQSSPFQETCRLLLQLT
jgi:hypothetical protein